MALSQWALPELRKLLPLDDEELRQVVAYTSNLSDAEAAQHLQGLLGETPEALAFVALFLQRRQTLQDDINQSTGADGGVAEYLQPAHATKGSNSAINPAMRSSPESTPGAGIIDSKSHGSSDVSHPPAYAASAIPSGYGTGTFVHHRHSNAVIQAGNVRARDEQDMQQLLQNLQYEYRIYNAEIEPEHDTEYYCSCSIHRYQQRKWNRLGVQEMWSRAVMYPGERSYSNTANASPLFSSNPYLLRVGSPYGYSSRYTWGPPRPVPQYHMQWIRQTIALNNQLNREAQARVDSKEPSENIWDEGAPPDHVGSPNPGSKFSAPDAKLQPGESSDSKRRSIIGRSAELKGKSSSQFAGFKKALGIKSTEEKAIEKASSLRRDILAEEQGRWPDPQYRRLVSEYQEKIGIARKVAELRARCPIQYLHLLRAGYFEPIPVVWATQASNPLKFSIEAQEGWRGITPAWRGYEDLAEERLYWVLNHRDGSAGVRMKPDFMSAMDMARARMAAAVEPPPMYYSSEDTCIRQHVSTGYSKQVMPAPFHAYDRPELPTDDSMILLDVSGSMDFDPVRPIYDHYLITGYASTTQPKNKDVAKSIIRRFMDALSHHDHQAAGYDLVTFATKASYVGTINHHNFEQMWRNVRVGGGTRVMTGWQQVKEMHFQKHRESAVHHPVYGWQAGPETPILRLLLFLDGEATDMDEFELDLLSLSWAHVTIFLIGVDNCPHHHRHANELQRISDVNHRVSFVDAQGNCPERFVTHELLKRHLGYDISFREFEQMEELPAYSAV